jgi:hypothetical protein
MVWFLINYAHEYLYILHLPLLNTLAQAVTLATCIQKCVAPNPGRHTECLD